MADAVVLVRRALDKIKKSCPIFDLAFAVYLSKIMPGEPLPRAAHSSSAEGVSETIIDLLSEGSR